MIYTVTFNPAIDYIVRTKELIAGETNRSQSEEIYFGGKGINVSVVLKELGLASKALGFIAGFTGKAIEEGIQKAGIDTDFVLLPEGNSRINVKIKSSEETELNGQGPFIGEEAVDQLYAKLDKLTDGDVLVLAGSIPSSMPSDIYEKILARLSDKKIKVVVDATKDLLLNVLKYKPFLIKPNDFELGEMFGVKITTIEEIVHYATKLKEMGAVNVLISRAGDGAVLVDERGEVHSLGVCKGKVKNSVGAGDSMVAGFIAGSMEGDYEYALKLGTATGGATAFSEGLAKREEIFALLETLCKNRNLRELDPDFAYEVTSKVHEIEYKDSQGVKITLFGELFMPKAEGKFPVIILSHGFNGHYRDFPAECRRFTERGYICYAFDFCGAQSGGQSTGRNAASYTPYTMKEDLKAVIADMTKLDNVDKSQVFLFGGSQGGFVTSLTAADEDIKNRVAAIAMYFPAMNIPDDWRSAPIVDTPLMGYSIGANFIRSIRDLDPFKVIGNYKKDVCIVWGTKDALVMRSYIDAAVKAYGEDRVDLTILEGAGHGFGGKDLTTAIEKVLSFFESHTYECI